MKIEQIKIENYKEEVSNQSEQIIASNVGDTLNIEIDNIEKISTIIGQNDCGKSNICDAILKVLDFEQRKKPFLESDSTMANKKPIHIQIKLSVDDLTIDQCAIIREYIHKDSNNNKYVIVRLKSTYNNEILEYEDSLYIGDPKLDEIEVQPYRQNALDKILSVIYINPSYNKEKEQKNFFSFKEEINKEREKMFSNKIEDRLNELKNDIQEEDNIQEMQTEINQQGKFREILDGIKFEIVPNIRMNSIYKSLDIVTLNENGTELNNIGDGKNKIFSMLLKNKTYDNEKKKIYIVEEPENHLYVLLQRYYVEALMSLNPDQLLITTHSPYIIDFEKNNQIIKVDYNSKNSFRNILKYSINNESFQKLGYLINAEVAEMLYYNNVLLVEGESEKYFYNLLLIKDEKFHEFIVKNKFGIFAVNGIAFEPIKKMLEALGVNVFIKTDNDIFPVQNKKNVYRYAGLERCIKYIKEETKNKLKKLLGWEDFDKEKFRFEGEDTKIINIESKIHQISKILFEDNILFSVHNEGFEKDFLDYIGYDKLKYNNAFNFLKKAKLKNLHEFICENSIDICINNNDKNSILVRFMNE